MEKVKGELEKLRDEINVILRRRDEYFKWLRKNLDSPRWEEMKQDWNNMNNEIRELREQRDNIILNNL